jgi:tetratricopeptide (TPR) repeat protein
VPFKPEKDVMKKTVNFILFFLILISLNTPVSASVINRINLMDQGKKVTISLDKYADFRVYQSDEYEFVIIFKGTEIDENIITGGSGGDLISKIYYEHFPDNISILTIQTTKKIGSVDELWNDSSNKLQVLLNVQKGGFTNKKPKYQNKKNIKSAKKDVVKRTEDKKVKKEEVKEDKPVREVKEEPVKEDKKIDDSTSDYLMAKPSKTYKKGGIKTITDYLKDKPCAASVGFKVSLRQADSEDYLGALGTIENEFINNGDSDCIDELEFYRAYLKYQAMGKKDISLKNNLKTEVESLINVYSNSDLLPYGYSIAALINEDIENYPYAIGFFDLVQDQYNDYPGMAQVYFQLGNIYYKNGDLRRSEEYLNKLSKQFPQTQFAAEASMVQGQILYSKKRYFDTIRTLSPVISNNRRVIYQNPKLLNFVANSYFKTGKNKEARGLFSRMFNIFPDMEEKDMILTSIGETFYEEGHKEKALKIYRLVTERYPGTKGFVKSSLNLADNMDDDQNREIIYTMIVNDFPDSVEARISFMRLANLYLKQKRYMESIDSVKSLFKENARALRKDALYVMAKSLHGELTDLLNEDKFPAALRMIEKERFLINDMKTFDIHFISGIIYTDGHLYQEAEERLKRAKKLIGKKKPPVKLYKYRAIANKELGNFAESVSFADEIIKSYKNSDEVPCAYEMKGDIEVIRKKYKRAEKFYNESVKKYKDMSSKGNVEIKLGELMESLDNHKKSETAFTKALAFYLDSDDKNTNDNVSYAAKKLGEIKLTLQDFNGAATSFQTVFEKGGGKENLLEVRFLSGEAYKGMKNNTKALEEYNKVLTMDSDEEFWKRMARQRIREIELEKELENS